MILVYMGYMVAGYRDGDMSSGFRGRLFSTEFTPYCTSVGAIIYS